MTYAIIQSGAVARYPANPFSDNPTTSFASGWTGGVVSGVEYVTVQPSAQPAHDTTTQTVAEATPALVAGVWTQQWTVTAADAATQAQRVADAKAARIAAINAEAQQRITARWPLWAQSNVALGVYSEPEATACRDWIAAHIEASNTASDAITAATTVDAVNAVTVVWPV